MKKYIILSILLTSICAFSATKKAVPSQDDHLAILRQNEKQLSTLISGFEVQTTTADGLQIELLNMNGVKKAELLKTKMEEYQEYTRYSFNNPFDKKLLELYIFEKIKPSILDNKEINSDADISEIRLNLMVLMDPAGKKTLKSKAQVFYKEVLVAEGSIEGNSAIKMTNDLSLNLKNCKMQEFKVTNNLLNSDKRSFDLQIKFAQNGKSIKQNLNVNLLNMKQTPKSLSDEEGNEDEATVDHS
jgi:hypothetical protein